MLYETINILIKVSTEFIPPIAIGYYVIRHLRQHKCAFLLIAIDIIVIWGVRERSLACMINRGSWIALSDVIGSVKSVISNLCYRYHRITAHARAWFGDYTVDRKQYMLRVHKTLLDLAPCSSQNDHSRAII